MTYDDIVYLLEEMGLPFAYDHFEEGESPTVPFMAFLLSNDANFHADGKNYLKITSLTIELYTDEKNPALESRLESIFEKHDLVCSKREAWIESEKLYQVFYETEVLYEG